MRYVACGKEARFFQTPQVYSYQADTKDDVVRDYPCRGNFVNTKPVVKADSKDKPVYITVPDSLT